MVHSIEFKVSLVWFILPYILEWHKSQSSKCSLWPVHSWPQPLQQLGLCRDNITGTYPAGGLMFGHLYPVSAYLACSYISSLIWDPLCFWSSLFLQLLVAEIVPLCCQYPVSHTALASLILIHVHLGWISRFLRWFLDWTDFTPSIKFQNIPFTTPSYVTAISRVWLWTTKIEEEKN